MSEFPSPIPRPDCQSSAAAPIPGPATGPYPPANGQQQHRSDRSQSADSRRSRGYLTAGAIKPSALRRDDDSASAQSRTNLGHDRRRSFSASRPRSFSMGREPMFSRDSFSRKDPKWGRDQSSSSREPSRDSEEKRRSESWSNERSSSDSWRCTECNIWNAGDLDGCQRCQSPRRAGGFNDHGRRARSASRNSTRSEFSFYGRFSVRSESHSPGRRLPVLQNLEVCEWPPCFDREGSAFVFDSRSGMFYESRSDFFYDPKSKLYYGNKKGSYFRYDDATNPPFIEVHRMVPAAGTTESPPGDSSTASVSKPDAVIAIKLKTKKIKKPKGSTDAKVVHIVSKVQKEQVANIEKWSEKKAEIQADDPVLPSRTAKPLATTIVPRPAPAAADHVKVATTAKGEPMCITCRRKFLTLDKLRLHEKVSEMHKQNLAKLTTSKEKRELVPSGEYQDRAKKRRAMHGSDSIMPPPKKPVVPPSAKAAPVVAHDLGSNNIGNQLLQKLGWKAGSSLGRKAEDKSGGPDGPTSALGRDQSQVQNLRKDWATIEALASDAARYSGRPN